MGGRELGSHHGPARATGPPQCLSGCVNHISYSLLQPSHLLLVHRAVVNKWRLPAAVMSVDVSVAWLVVLPCVHWVWSPPGLCVAAAKLCAAGGLCWYYYKVCLVGLCWLEHVAHNHLLGSLPCVSRTILCVGMAVRPCVALTNTRCQTCQQPPGRPGMAYDAQQCAGLFGIKVGIYRPSITESCSLAVPHTGSLGWRSQHGCAPACKVQRA